MTEKPVWFQKLFYKETAQAIKSSLDFLCYESFKNDLVLLLPQESKKSRIRIANNILHRFFPDKKLYNFPAQTWQIYNNDEMLQEIIRYEFLSQESVISNFVIMHILTRSDGDILPARIFNNYITESYGKEIMNLVWWLQSAIKDLGFIEKIANKWQIKNIRTPEIAFILLLHKILAPYPASIDIEAIISNDFWKLIGIRDPDTIKTLLYKAHLMNIITYKGNTITTLYPLESLFLVLKPDKN